MILFSDDMKGKEWQVNQLTERTRGILTKIIHFLEERYGYHVYITSLIRTEQQQKAIAEKLEEEYVPSVHQYGRGVDFRLFPDMAFNQDLASSVNTKWIYDKDRIHMKTLLVHEGTGPHFHLQSLT